MPKYNRLRRTLPLILIILIVAGGLFLMWLRPNPPLAVSFSAASIGDDIEAYLDRQEARFGDIRDGLNKRVVWAYPQSRAKTPLAIVFVHGFSASSDELRPLTDILAERLGANLYYTRLTGHGRTGDAMAEATVSLWADDIAEALEIGRRIGERIILIGSSTGATLNTWAAAQPEQAGDIAGIVQVSPNFGINAFGARLLTFPGGRQLAELLQGKRRSFEPENDLTAHIWTTEYPTAAILPMAELIELTARAAIPNIRIPALFIYSEKDTVVRPEMTRSVIERWGGDTEVAIVDDSDSADNHVIAGDAQSPSTTNRIADIILAWVESLPEPS